MSRDSIIESLEMRKELKRLDEWVIKNLGDNAGIEISDGEMKPVVVAGAGVNRLVAPYYINKVKELMNMGLSKLLKSYYEKNGLVMTDSDLRKAVTKIQDTLLADKSTKSFSEVLSRCLMDVLGLPIPLSRATSETLEEIYKKSLGYNPTKPEKVKE